MWTALHRHGRGDGADTAFLELIAGKRMGLFAFRIRFDSAPPSEAVLRAELLRQAGSITGLDAFEIKNNTVEITTDLNPVTRPYALKIPLDLGGVYVDFATGEPRDAKLPAYVRAPWRAWPLWTRASIHARFHLGLLSTALPLRRRSHR
jgi:hypothetical protein